MFVSRECYHKLNRSIISGFFIKGRSFVPGLRREQISPEFCAGLFFNNNQIITDAVIRLLVSTSKITFGKTPKILKV